MTIGSGDYLCRNSLNCIVAEFFPNKSFIATYSNGFGAHQISKWHIVLHLVISVSTWITAGPNDWILRDNT